MAVNNYHKHYHERRTKKVAKQPIDRFIYVAVIAGPLMTIPQLYNIWALKENGVSMVSWIAYLLIAFLWLAYGIKHKSLPVITVQVLWIVMDAGIVLGLLFVAK